MTPNGTGGLRLHTNDESFCVESPGYGIFFLAGGGGLGPIAKTFAEAIAIVLHDDRVQVLFVNIFGGLANGYLIIESILRGYKLLSSKVSVVARVQGADEGMRDGYFGRR